MNDGGWEALMVSSPSNFNGHVDFWRIEPKGAFYLRRELNDDLSAKSHPPMTTLDFGLPVYRIAEALAVALSFVRTLGANGTLSLAVACRWTGLKGRELSSWADFNRSISRGYRAHQDSVTSTIVLPADLAPNSLAEPVWKLMRPMYALFDGFELARSVNDDLVQKLLSRRY